MLREIVIDLFHRTDSFRINLAGWSRAGAVGFDLVASVNAGECFGHLAAVRILDTDKQQTLRSKTSSGRLIHKALSSDFKLSRKPRDSQSSQRASAARQWSVRSLVKCRISQT